jgi:hypothetical protein
MSADAFIKSTPQIDALVNGATNFEQLRESVKSELERNGMIARDWHDPYNGTLLRKPEMAIPDAVAAEPTNQGPTTHYRVIYPFQNDRYELTGYSEAELDQKEAAIRSAIGAPGRS